MLTAALHKFAALRDNYREELTGCAWAPSGTRDRRSVGRAAERKETFSLCHGCSARRLSLSVDSALAERDGPRA
jgi:hypothetical protein